MNVVLKQRIPLKIKRMGINGEGIGFYKKTLIFVPGALKGEEVFCQISSVRRNFAEAKLLKINKKSKNRVDPACSIYKECGGCQIMHLQYDKQLEFKTDVIRQALMKFKPEGYENYEIRKTIGMPEPEHYRAKLQFQVRSFGGNVKAGLYAQGTHRLIDIKDCLVQDSLTQEMINRVAELLGKYKLPIYNERKIAGVRTVMIRRAQASGEVQLIFITSKRLDFDDVVIELVREFPELKTVAVNINASKTSDIYGQITEVIWGQESINEEVLDYGFSLSPRAFYQLNPKQTQILYSEAVKALDVKDDDDLIDAYCGVGTIGLAFAGKVKSVRGMDIIPEAIIPRWYSEGFRANALIVDPPRTGLDDKLLNTILKMPPEKMVYVSCNTSTLARDLVTLTKVYHVHYIQSVDMFPHTARTEAVVKLQRKV
ncbi:TPA: 23S rRNA (uracil(1939)-C(5))-methyltransferase RlmD [Streptococcus agalactiae]